MSDKYNDLLVGIVLSVLMVGMTAFNFYLPVLRVALALLFVLALPGYALSTVLFPRQDISGLERLLFSIGMSLGTAIIGGLVLNFTPWGLQVTSWTLLLALITLVASLAAILRRRKAPASDSIQSRFHLTVRQVIIFALAGLLVSAAIGLRREPSLPYNAQGYTSLWMLPAPQPQQNAVLLGIHSGEFASTEYRLRVILDGKQVQEWPYINLEPGEQWQQQVILPAGHGMVFAILTRADNPGKIYRQVSLAWNSTGN